MQLNSPNAQLLQDMMKEHAKYKDIPKVSDPKKTIEEMPIEEENAETESKLR